LVDSFVSMMMHGLANPKNKSSYVGAGIHLCIADPLQHDNNQRLSEILFKFWLTVCKRRPYIIHECG
jgi:hypothetical protein